MNALLVIIAAALLGYAGAHPEGMDKPVSPGVSVTQPADPTPTPDVCQALRDVAAKHGQHIDDCHSYQERTVG